MTDIYEPIERLVPHRGTLSLLDRVVFHDRDCLHAEVRVPMDSPFGDSEGVPAWLGIEYMAQAIAAWAGMRARQRGAEPSIGFLLGSRRYGCSTPLFAAGHVLRIEVRCELLGENGLGMFACRIVDGDEEVATANVSVYEPADAFAYLEEGK